VRRPSELIMVLAAAAITGFGITLVNLAEGGALDAQVGLTFLVFALAFVAFHLTVGGVSLKATESLIPPVALLVALGLIEIYRLSPFRAGLQRWWLIIAAAIASGVLWWLHRCGLVILRRFRNLTLLGALGLLLLPLLPSDWPLPIRGLEINGSRLWIVIDAGFMQLNFQPGELAKILLVVFVAGYLADRQPALHGVHRRIGKISIPEPRQLMPLAVIWVVSLGVLVFQRDLGASLLLFVVVVLMLYSATGYLGYITGGGILSLIGAVAAWQSFDHVQRRVTAWLTPFQEFEGAGYQVAQGLFGLANGSLAGAGPGLGRPDLIPNAMSDFIFAAVGEEFGFGGVVAVLGAYAILIAVGFGISLRSRDRFRKLLAAGLTFVLAVQSFLIIGGILRLVPLTGIALPFMSYGGSSLLGNFVVVALLLRISHEEAL